MSSGYFTLVPPTPLMRDATPDCRLPSAIVDTPLLPPR